MTYTYHIRSKSQYHQFNICDRYHVTYAMKQHKISHLWFASRNILYINIMSHLRYTVIVILEKIQKLPKYHIFVDVTIYPTIDCELCYHCFTLPCECAQMDMMMKPEKGELKSWKISHDRISHLYNKICEQNIMQ